MITELLKAFAQEVTCPSCSKKTHGHKNARNTISCHWCGKTLEDKAQNIDLFPSVERIKK